MPAIAARRRATAPVPQSAVQPKSLPVDDSILTFRDMLAELHRAGFPICGYTLRKHIQAGHLPVTRTGYRILIRQSDADRFIDKLASRRTLADWAKS